MNASVYFPIVVDLSQFFYDHRRTARIFVNDSIKSVSDLQDRLARIFSIRDFYLSTGGHFLPESEDIGVLQKNETVCVIPKGTSAHQTPKKTKENRRADLDVIEEEERSRTASPKKKKCKKKHHSHADDEPQSRKSKRDGEEEEEEGDATERVHKRTKKDKERHRDSAQTMGAIKKKLREKTEEHIERYSKPDDRLNYSIKTVLPKIQDHIRLRDGFGRANAPEPIRLSRHVDTPIAKYTRYVPPNRITDQYLAKNKVNIVRIDVINASNKEKSADPPVDEVVSPVIPTVREIINSFEESTLNDCVEVKASEYFEDASNMSVASTPVKNDAAPASLAPPASESSAFSETMELSSIRSDVSDPTAQLRPDMELLVDSLRERSDCITKRKRTRLRKRKKASREAQETPRETPRQLDRSAGQPNVHIKFEETTDQAMDVQETGTEQEGRPENGESTVLPTNAILLSDDNEESVMEIKHIGTEAELASAPSLGDVQPKPGDVIAFKVLKMDGDYNPQLSSFVIGRVMLFSHATNHVILKILRGRNELLPPSGKLSLDQDETTSLDELRYKEFSWSEMMERKLLYSRRSDFIQNHTA